MQSVIPSVSQLPIVNAIKLPFATGLLKLCKSPLALSADTVKADLAAVEADYTGYAAITLVALPATYSDTGRGGYSWSIPTQQWDTDPTPTVTNMIYGGWIESAGGALLYAWQTAVPIPMVFPHQSLALEATFNFFGLAGFAKQYLDINGQPIS